MSQFWVPWSTCWGMMPPPSAMSRLLRPWTNKVTPSPPRQRRRGCGRGRRDAGTMFTSTGATRHATTRMPPKIVRSIESPCSFKSSLNWLQLTRKTPWVGDTRHQTSVSPARRWSGLRRPPLSWWPDASHPSPLSPESNHKVYLVIITIFVVKN